MTQTKAHRLTKSHPHRSYYREVIFDGLKVFVYKNDEPHVEGGLFFDCDLCGDFYGHWWCDPVAWRCLPPQIHKKFICLSCFRAVRKLRKLKAFT